MYRLLRTSTSIISNKIKHEIKRNGCGRLMYMNGVSINSFSTETDQRSMNKIEMEKK